MSINRVNLNGRLTHEPELHYTSDDTPVLNFTLAVTERRKNRTGNWEEYVNYIPCVLFGNRAEHLIDTLCKGYLISVDGKLHYSTWEKNGERRKSIDVTVGKIELLRQPLNRTNNYNTNYNTNNDDEWEENE